MMNLDDGCVRDDADDSEQDEKEHAKKKECDFLLAQRGVRAFIHK